MAITINSLDVSDNVNYLVESVRYKSNPSRALTNLSISRRPGDKLVANEWGSKEIEISGRIFGSSYSDLLTKVDTFQQTVNPASVAISIDNGRSYTGSIKSLEIPEQFYNQTMVKYQANFLCVDPFAYGAQLSVSGTTVSGTTTETINLTISGSVFAEPTLQINPTGALTGDSGIRQIKVTHVTSGETMTISGNLNYTASDIIDYDNFSVTISGVDSDYSGIFSRFEPGANQVTITILSGVTNGYLWKFAYQPRYYQ